jgi:DNA-binding NarL/FixJ family response regulator
MKDNKPSSTESLLALVREHYVERRRQQQHENTLRRLLPLVYFSAIGMTRKEMASAAGLSIRTIEANFQQLLEELDCRSAPHIVGKCFERGYLVVVDGEIKLNDQL